MGASSAVISSLLNRFLFSASTLRMRLHPLACGPSDGYPMRMSPCLMVVGSMRSGFSTQPMQNPASSMTSVGTIPGISAVSPPARMQPQDSR